jgi:small subunit ribosomal protein S4
MPWIQLDPDSMKGVLNAIPGRNDVTDLAEVNEQLIVELYSR